MVIRTLALLALGGLLLPSVPKSHAQAPNFDLVTGVELSSAAQVGYSFTPADAVALAVADLSELTQDNQPFQRYIWIPDPNREKIGAVSYAVNTACVEAATIVNPVEIGNGQLLRWDLRQMAPRDGDVNRLLQIWEKLQFEPYFHIIRDSEDALPTNAIPVQSKAIDPPGSIRFRLEDEHWFRSALGNYFVWDGAAWNKIVTPPFQVAKSQKIATFGAHCGLEQATILQGLTQSNAPIVRYDFFITKALSTVDGGLYYEFAQVGDTQDEFMELLGVDLDIVANARSDQRAAIFRSGVSGKPRRIEAFQGSGIRPGGGTGLVTVTYDLFDENVDAAGDPFRNLLEMADDGREIIGEKPNGMHRFGLFDKNGDVIEVAPDNLVKDHTIPAPHTARLQPAISCIRCHAPQNGLQPINNEVQTLLKGSLDVFDDLASQGSLPDTLDRLAGLYAGDLGKPIRRAVDDYTDAVYRATGGSSPYEAGEVLSNIYANYNYKMVDAQQACLELGYVVPEEEATDYLKQIVPRLPQDVLGISPEDPIVGALKAGLSINRYQFEAIYADMAFRAMQARIQSQ